MYLNGKKIFYAINNKRTIPKFVDSSLLPKNKIYITVPQESLNMEINGLGEIDWGDGTINNMNTHTYAQSGDYVVQFRDATLQMENSHQAASPSPFASSKFKVKGAEFNTRGLGEGAFNSCEELTYCILNSKQDNKIPFIAFRYSGLQGIYIPKNIITIEEQAFSSCQDLISVTFEDGSLLNEIGRQAFEDCTSLQRITIPKNVTMIGVEAFKNSSLTWVTFESNSRLSEIEDSAFQGINAIGVTLPSSLRKIGNSVFSHCPYLFSVTINEGTTHIGSRAFEICPSLNTIQLPSTIQRIGNNIISGMSLQTINYNGTIDMFGSIDKSYNWYGDAINFKVVCTDGSIEF